MKNLAKVLKNFVLYPALALTLLNAPLKAVSQDTKKPETSFYGQINLNPNISINAIASPPETFTLNYYGSGDVNGDGKIDWTDYNQILGSSSDRADIDGDGNPGTANDKLKLFQYLTDQIQYLPAHWNLLQNRNERISWFQKVLAIDQTQAPHPGWSCFNWYQQFPIPTIGVEYIAGSGLSGQGYDISHNARFNIPVYKVDDQDILGAGHGINGTLVGDSTSNSTLNSWYFVDESNAGNESRVYPGTTSMNANSYVHIKRYCYFYNQAFNQYVYDDLDLIWFQLQNGQVSSITYQNPDAVMFRTLHNVHLHGNKPVDATVDWNNGVADTSAAHTGYPTNISPSGTQSTHSDSTNQNSNIYNYNHFNYDDYRDWVLVDTSSHGIIDTTLGSRRYVFWHTLNPNRPPQIIHIRDQIPPQISSTPNGLNYNYSQFNPANIPATTATDNSGYWFLKSRTINSNQNSDPNNCAHYSFTDTVIDSISDYSNNISVATSLVNIVLDPTVWTYVPPAMTLNWPASTDPSNTGMATASNPALPVNVNYSDNSNQNPDPAQCSHYSFSINPRTFTATTTPSCNNQINSTQTITMQAINQPTITYVPHDTIVPVDGCLTPACLGVAQGADYQTGQPVIPNSYDSIIYNGGGDSILFDRHHWVTTLCGIPSQQGIQHVMEMVVDGTPVIGYGKGKTFYVYPNPVTASENVNFRYVTTKPEKVEIRVSDMAGKQLEDIVVEEQTPGEHSTPYNVSGLSSGVYAVTYTSPEYSGTTKLVKSR